MRPVIESALDRYSLRAIEGCTQGIQEAIRYSLLNPGKRIRPLLTLMAAEACGGDLERALPAACAVEMIHVFSLIHDDLPAMDDDDVRRGKPSSHKVFGEGEAILAGDALLTLAFQILAEDVRPPEVAVRCASALARCVGACGMQGGQWDDLRQHPDRSSTAKRKTAVLIEAALHLGSLTAQATPVQISALREFGWRVGMAFQLVDDALDGEGGEVEAMKLQARACTAEAIEHLIPFGEEAQALKEIAQQLMERTA